MRRRYRYDPELKAVVEIGSDWTDVERRAPAATEELTYGGMRATDGTDISSRKKHREYLKATGYAMASDFTESGKTAAAEREKFFRGEHRDPTIREDIGRALYQRERRKK
jgi:hypothetical protein